MQGGQVHVVEQHHACTRVEGFCQLGQGFDLDFNKAGGGGYLGRTRQHLGHATGRRDVVFLDQHRVIQANAVVGAAAGAHRVFLRQPQAGQGFAGVHNVGRRAFDGLHIHRGFSGHGAEQLQKIQCCALGRQQRSGLALHFQNHLIRGAALAVLQVPGDAGGRVALENSGVGPGAAADDGGLTGDDPRMDAALGVHQSSGQVASTHVFQQGAGHVGSGQLGHGGF